MQLFYYQYDSVFENFKQLITIIQLELTNLLAGMLSKLGEHQLFLCLNFK